MKLKLVSPQTLPLSEIRQLPLFDGLDKPLPETPKEERINASKVTIQRLLIVRKSLEQTRGAQDSIHSINKLIREIKSNSILTDSQRLALVRIAVTQRYCQTYEDITDELSFELKTNISLSSVKSLVAALVSSGELEIVPRAVAGRNKLIGHIIRPKTTFP